MIDIIIPAYNAHKTIEKTLLSICLQTIKDKINVIIVDDCSKKDYSEIVTIFKNTLNIRQIKLDKNSGPGVARQFGLDNSNSEYIMFADSDDIFYDCFSIENIYNKIVDTDYELASGILCVEELEQLNFYDIHTVCLHANMYRRTYIEKNKFRFNNTRTSEDMSFNTLYVLSNPKTLYENSNTYVYRYNPNSITKSDIINYPFDMLELYIYNTIWFTKQAEDRNYDSHEIAKYIFTACITTYFKYLEYLSKPELNLIFKWFAPLLEIYKKYNLYLSDDEKYELHEMYIRHYVPKISFYEFINLASMYCG